MLPSGNTPAPLLTRAASLDGLRLVCCLMVVVGHAAWGPVLGRAASYGVDVFFALSGFLITRLLLREKQRDGAIALRAFYARRARRIGPVYYASLVAAFGLTWALGAAYAGPFRGPRDGRFFSTTLGAYALFAGNLTDAPVPSTVEVLWSVCVEEQFYVVFPPLIAWSKARLPALAPASVGLVLAWATRLFLASRGDAELYRNPLAHADGLLLGALAAQLFEASPAALSWVTRRATAIEVAAAALATTHLVFRSGSTSPLSYWSSFVISALTATALVLALSTGAGRLGALLATRSVAGLGVLTYPAYAAHMYGVTAAYGITLRLPLGPLGAPLRVALAVALSLGLGWAVHVLVERPFATRPARV